jgi:hypothetical protein
MGPLPAPVSLASLRKIAKREASDPWLAFHILRWFFFRARKTTTSAKKPGSPSRPAAGTFRLHGKRDSHVSPRSIAHVGCAVGVVTLSKALGYAGAAAHSLLNPGRRLSHPIRVPQSSRAIRAGEWMAHERELRGG